MIKEILVTPWSSDMQIIMIIATFKYERKKSWKQPIYFKLYMLGGPFQVITATIYYATTSHY